MIPNCTPSCVCLATFLLSLVGFSLSQGGIFFMSVLIDVDQEQLTVFSFDLKAMR